jgi:HYDIN/CFA65/VesB family protein/centrosomal CEP192-like protein/beta-propeller repeat-containing protein
VFYLRHCARYFCLFALSFSVLLPVSGKEAPQLHSLPLAFEQNQGQAPSAAGFVMRRDGVSAFFRRDGVEFRLPGQAASGHRLELTLDAPEVTPEGRNLQPGHTSYLMGRDAANWIRNIPLYSAIEYPQLYPGISLLFYGNGDSLEHDFKLSAGADPGKIAFRLKGADEVHIDPQGDLQVQVAGGQLALRRPVAYQEIRGRKRVEANFALDKDGTVRFRVGSYDHSQPLVIDPVFTFSTYLAGTGIDQISAVTTDSAGDVYATGWTSSTDFPLDKPLEQACSHDACRTIFVTKLDPSGHTLLYSTYLGDAGVYGVGGGIAVSSSGNAVITGSSMGNSFPQVGNLPSIAQCPNGGGCYFLVSLKPDGSAFNYSGMLLAEQSNYGNSGVVTVDAAGNAYMSGGTWLSSFPVTPGTLATSVPGYPFTSTFVVKVDPTGKLLYSTIIPGTSPQDPANTYNNAFNASGIVVDSKGQVTIGGTAGMGLPTTAGVIQGTFPNATDSGDREAGFILQLNANASAVNFASYLPGTDSGTGMVTDKAGNYYFAGYSLNSNLPVSSNAYQKTLPSGSCNCYGGYIMKVNPTATAVLAATYLNPQPSASPGFNSSTLSGIAIDSHNNVFVEGTSSSAAFPMKNPFVTQWETGTFAIDMVLAELNPDLSSLLFGSFLNPADGVYAGSVPASIAVDDSDKLIVAGLTLAVDFPTTENAVQPNLPAPASFLSTPPHSFISKIDMSVPAPSVCLNTTSVGFSSVPAKTTSSQSVKVTNCGNAPLTVASALSSDPSVVATDDCTDIAAGSACTIKLTFTPLNTTAISGNISIADNAAVSPQTFSFAGQGTGAQLVTQPTALSFGHLLVGTKGPNLGLFLNNSGTVAATISKISVSGAGYSLAANNCPATLNPRQFCNIQIAFSPTAAGPQNGSLVISSNDPVNPTLTVALTGTGDATYGAPEISSIGSGTVQINNGPVQITVLGSNFYPATVVQLSGVTQQSSFVSNSQITVTLAAASLTTLGEETLSVTNPGIAIAATAVVTPYATLPVNPAALVSVSATKLLYAAIPASSTTNPNTVLPIDPVTLTTGTPIPVGNDPVYLAASSDGSYLYVANRGDQTVQRINLQIGSVERTFPYSPNPFCTGCNILDASDLEAVPGSPTEVVLAQNDMLSLYNDSGLVNYSPTGFVEYFSPTFSNFAFAGTPLTIYSVPFTTIQNPFFEITTLDSVGLHWSPVTGTNYGPPSGIGNHVVSDGTLLYTSGGGVWDPSTKKQVGSFPVHSDYDSSIALNTATHRVIAIGFQNYDSEGYNTVSNILTAYSTQSYKLLGALAFPQISSPLPAGLTLWGTDGLAFLVDNAVYLTRSSLTGTEAENPLPVITSISPTSTPAKLAQPDLTITGTGFVPDSYVLWNGKRETVQYYSSTKIVPSLTTNDVATPGNVTLQVVNPAPGGGSSAVVNYTIGPSIPIASFLQTVLDFGSVEAGQTSPSQEVFLTNMGAGVLHISSVTASGDYTVTSTCGTALGAHGLCRIFVTFTPSASGTRTGTLSVNDDSGNTPQTISLTGVGISPLAIADAAGGSNTATVSAGGTATYNLTLSSTGGFNGAVALTCSGAPANSTCTVAPDTLNVTADGSNAFTVTVATNVKSSNSIASPGRIALGGLAALSLFILPFVSRARRSALSSLTLLLVISTGLILGCGGGGNSAGSGGGGGGTPPPSGGGGSSVTPAGTYILTVKAASGNVTATQALTLTVQ